MKQSINEVRVKELLSDEMFQKAIKDLVLVPNIIIIKQVKKPFTNEETKITTQKISAVSGTTLQDMVSVDFTLVGVTIDPIDSINKEFKIIEYSLALEANMRGGNFNGYSATGLKLMISGIELRKGAIDGNNKN